MGLGNDSSAGQKEIKRISSISKDLSQVKKIYLHAGLVSTVEFKQAVIGVKVGNTDSIKAEISPSNPKEVTLRLKHQNAEPTNMIVRVDRHVYVFDLIPSKTSHQDYVLIRGSFGFPQSETAKERSKISAGLNASEAHDRGVIIQSRAPKSKLIESVKLGDE
ncbi:hypothetical protein NWE73_08935 [Bdellovibrio sp. PAP01]|uniref:Uncharacterized protein n=2 Tax=Bdellovibrio svalbardensis TaxID=2972972 RepID=A0ABT6DI75_9BACT|nr:hypothetical protein [Bdellovibrio svalbardensis]